MRFQEGNRSVSHQSHCHHFSPNLTNTHLHLNHPPLHLNTSTPVFTPFSFLFMRSSPRFRPPRPQSVRPSPGFLLFAVAPTKKPSMFGFVMSSLQFSGVTLPPYLGTFRFRPHRASERAGAAAFVNRRPGERTRSGHVRKRRTRRGGGFNEPGASEHAAHVFSGGGGGRHEH